MSYDQSTELAREQVARLRLVRRQYLAERIRHRLAAAGWMVWGVLWRAWLVVTVFVAVYAFVLFAQGNR